MRHMQHLEDLAELSDFDGHSSVWSSWGSPIGLIIFFNGMAFFAILIRYAFLMK